MVINVLRVAEVMRIEATTVILPRRLSQHRKKMSSSIATTINGKCALPIKIALRPEKARVNNIITDMTRSRMLPARARLVSSRCLKGALAGGSGGAVHRYHHSRASCRDAYLGLCRKVNFANRTRIDSYLFSIRWSLP